MSTKFSILCIGLLFFSLNAERLSVKYFGKLYRSPDVTTTLIAVLNDGSELSILNDSGAWLEVQGNGYRGWIEKSHTNLIDTSYRTNVTGVSTSKKTTTEQPSSNSGGAPLIVFILLAIIAAVVVVVLKLKAKAPATLSDTQTIDPQMNATLQLLMICKKDKTIQSRLSNIHKRLSTCFKELGFHVSVMDSVKNVDSLSVAPHIIAVDVTTIARPIVQIEKLIEDRIISVDTTIIFYNIPKPDKISPSSYAHAFYLGKVFTEPDLMSIISQVITAQEESNPSILQGVITGQGIFEILQLLEVGQKSGVLKLNNTEGKLVGALAFNMGDIVFAQTANAVGDDAAMILVQQVSGDFQFHREQFAGRNCMIKPITLMMQAAQLTDEN